VAAGELPGFVALGIGQEAVMVGIIASLEPGDWISSSHRDNGMLIARGADLGKVRAEYFGRATGYCKGKGGPWHLAVYEHGCIGCNGILGPSQTINNGIAFALKYNGTRNVSLVTFGDGAAQLGEFHEAMNLAAIWNLPAIFFCANNEYGISVASSYSSSVRDISARAASYGVPGVTIDGNDVLAVYEAVSEAVKRARAGDGPMLIEAKTTRLRGHVEGDEQTYRSQEEIEAAMRKDPLKRFEADLVAQDVLDANRVNAIWAEVAAEIQAAEKFVEESPYPPPEEALTDLFYEEARG
jgi:acetoin:2,6-dichlorophenolindophenol oxidoreductase subunit alpha